MNRIIVVVASLSALFLFLAGHAYSMELASFLTLSLSLALFFMLACILMVLMEILEELQYANRR